MIGLTKTARVLALVVLFVTSSPLLSIEETHAQQIDFPQAPANPRSVQECKNLNRSYYKILDQLSNQHSAIGWGRGKHVDAGPCCAAESIGTQWCRTYQSHAVLWEQIHCAQIQKRKAMKICLSRLKAYKDQVEDNGETFDVGKFVRGGALLERNQFNMAGKIIYYIDAYQLLKSWTYVGNDPSRLHDVVLDSAKFSITSVLGFNAVAREITADNVHFIGVIGKNLEVVLDRLTNQIAQEFPSISVSQAAPTPSINSAPSPVATKAIVMECWELESGGSHCRKSRHSLQVLENGGAECEQFGNVIRCF